MGLSFSTKDVYAQPRPASLRHKIKAALKAGSNVLCRATDVPEVRGRPSSTRPQQGHARCSERCALHRSFGSTPRMRKCGHTEQATKEQLCFWQSMNMLFYHVIIR